MYERAGARLNQNLSDVNVLKQSEVVPLVKTKEGYNEIEDIFPALRKYKEEHNIANLQKLCVEIVEFCCSVYASTRNDEERGVYRKMIAKLNK